jgi:adenosylmethionine-8-amino-7-oxononanoate aminotransferase
MITFAKAVTSGYAPLGGTIVNDRVYEPFAHGDLSFPHGYTFGGHPVSAAVALENLDVFEEEKLLENVRENSPVFRATLEKLLDLPIVGDVRGDGYFFGIELVKTRPRRRPSTTTSPSGCCAASSPRRCSTRGSTAAPTTAATP